MSDPLRLLLDSTSRLFDGLATPEALAAAEEGEWLAHAWEAVADHGLPLALLPDDAGGAELGLGQVVALLREAGGHALPLPLGETMIAAYLVHRAGLPVPDGPVVAAPVGDGDTLTLQHGKYGPAVLDGVVHRLPWGRVCRVVLVLASADSAGSQGTERSTLVLLDPGEGRREPGTNMAGEPRDDLHCDRLAVSAERVAPSPISLTELERLCTLVRLALMAGAMEQVLALTVEYAGERIQFGRPIGRFQAIQQHLAVLAGETAAVVAAAEAAAEDLAADPTTLAVGAAKARASEAVRRAAAIAHQVHGAIGFTREHRLHLFTRRLWSWRDENGDESMWWDAVGRAALDAGSDGLWSLLCGT